MLGRYIRYLRSQSKPVRERHAFVVAASFTVVVLLVWASALPGRMESISQAQGDEAAERPVASFFNRAREQLATVFEGATPSATTTPPAEIPSSAPLVDTLSLSPEDLEMARASASVPYVAPATTTPRQIRIATTTSPTVATTTP